MSPVVSGGFNFDTDPTNSVSYESWHPQLKFETSLRLVSLIVWPQEVLEATEVKIKKYEAKIQKSPISISTVPGLTWFVISAK